MKIINKKLNHYKEEEESALISLNKLLHVTTKLHLSRDAPGMEEGMGWTGCHS